MIKKIVAYLNKREMLKNMAVLTGGTTVAQLITFGASPILSRLYTEAEYGSFGIFTSIVSYFVVVSCLRLDQAIVIPKSDEEGKSIAQWAIKINGIVSVLALLVCAIAYSFFNVSAYLFLVGPTVFFLGLINVYNNYSTRVKTYRHNSNSRVVTGILLAGISILLGYLNFGAWGLIIGMFTGQLIGSAYMFKFLHAEMYSSKNTLTWKDVRKKYNQFIYINTPNSLIGLTESAGIVLLLGFFFDKTYVGAYYFAFRILKVPLSLIGSSVFQVFYKEASEMYSHGKTFFPTVKKLMLQLSLLSFPFFLLLFFIGEGLFVFVFGEEWSNAGSYATLFAPWFWLHFVASTVSWIPIIVNKQNVAFIVAIVNTIIRLLIILISGLYYTFEVLIYSLAIIQPIIMIFNNLWYFYMARKYGKNEIE